MEITFEKPKIYLTQSLLKQYQKVGKGLACPKEFDALYVSKTHESVPSDAMELGHYFEWKATGQLPRNGVEPKPYLLTRGENKGQPDKEYRNADQQAVNFKSDLSQMGFEILKTGVWLQHPMETDIGGTVDLLAKHPKYGECLIDLKYSGLINDKWNDLGWAEPGYKWHHMIQAVHYNLLKRVPFFFAVYSSANNWERKWFKVEIDPGETQSHYQMIQSVRKDISGMDFPPMPSLAKCRNCPVQCEAKATTPEIETVFYPQ